MNCPKCNLPLRKPPAKYQSDLLICMTPRCHNYGQGVSVPTIEEITPAEYHKDDMVPIPLAFQPEDVEFCSHDLTKGNCRHKECPFYAPHKSVGEPTKQ